MQAIKAFLDSYGLANTSGERHQRRKEALAKARAELKPDPITALVHALYRDHKDTEWCDGCKDIRSLDPIRRIAT